MDVVDVDDDVLVKDVDVEDVEVVEVDEVDVVVGAASIVWFELNTPMLAE